MGHGWKVCLGSLQGPFTEPATQGFQPIRRNHHETLICCLTPLLPSWKGDSYRRVWILGFRALLPVTVALDVVTLPVQIPVFIYGIHYISKNFKF